MSLNFLNVLLLETQENSLKTVLAVHPILKNAIQSSMLFVIDDEKSYSPNAIKKDLWFQNSLCQHPR